MSQDTEGGEPPHERAPHAWAAHLAEGNRTQARKRVAVQVIIHDTAGRLLLVDPAYKPDWDIPGGMAAANEPPAAAASRELREELGIHLAVDTLLCLDWVAPHGPWDDLLVFVFDGGVLPPQQAAALGPADHELSAVAFCSYTEAEQRLRDYVWRRTHAALATRRTGHTAHRHNGSPIHHPGADNDT